MSVVDLVQVVSAFAGARRLDRLRDRAALERHQLRQLDRLLRHVAAHAPFYAEFAQRPLAAWPVLEKTHWMANFDTLNTIGARLEPLMAQALESERTRQFTGTADSLSVGLSTGTSGTRGLFVASRAERNRWAGAMLARMLRGPLPQRQRIALLLRAGNSLYERIGGGGISFRFFDLASPWQHTVDGLRDFQPTLLVAPAQALGLLASQSAAQRCAPARVVSCAEVLEPLDHARIEAAFGVRVEQIYQATEGFLGATCEHGTLHLNEAHYLIEREYCTGDRSRFIPLVTDLYRHTQPVIRYRLNDVLTLADSPCACGRPTTALSAIAGRADDLLRLPCAGGWAPIFPDLLARAIVGAAPELLDYEVEEIAEGQWRVGTEPEADGDLQARLREAVSGLAGKLGATSPALSFTGIAPRCRTAKLRRVRVRARAA